MGGINILAIEDFLPDVIVIKDYLKEANIKYNFFHKTSLREGIELTQEQKIDIVLLDLSLTDATGFSTLTTFLEEVPGIPVVVMTGSSNKDLGERAVRVGAQDYVFKGTWDTRDIVKSIIFSLHRWEAKKRLKEEADQLKIDVHNMGRVFHIAKIGYWKMDIVTNAMKWDEEMFHIFNQPNGSFNPNFSDYMNFVHVDDKERVAQFFENVTRDTLQKEIRHKILITSTVVKEVLVRAGVEHNQLESRVSLIGSVQDMTAKQEDYIQFHQKLEAVRKDSILQSIFAAFYSENDIKFDTLFTLCKKSSYLQSALGESFYYELIHFISYTFYKEVAKQIIMRSIGTSLREEELVTQDDFKAIISILGSNCFPEFKLALKDNLPESFSLNMGLFYLLLYAIYNLVNKQSSLEKLALNIDYDKKQDSGDFIFITITGCLDLSFMDQKENTLDSIYSSTIQPLEEKNQFWQRFIVLQIMDYTNCLTKLGANKRKTEQSFKMLYPITLSDRLDKNAEDSSSNKDLNLLIVDDRYFNRLNVKTSLTELQGRNIIVQEAENGKDALKKLETQKFDFVLMDSHMPIMDGIEASKNMKRHYGELFIVMMYNHLSNEEKANCEAIGIDGYLQKPINKQKLITVIEDLLDKDSFNPN